MLGGGSPRERLRGDMTAIASLRGVSLLTSRLSSVRRRRIPFQERIRSPESVAIPLRSRQTASDPARRQVISPDGERSFQAVSSASSSRPGGVVLGGSRGNRFRLRDIRISKSTEDKRPPPPPLPPPRENTSAVTRPLKKCSLKEKKISKKA